MSNSRERRELEALIIEEYKRVNEVLASMGQSLDTDSQFWSLGTWMCWCRYQGLRDAAKLMGMGEYDYGRCDRIVNGTQYGQESYS